MGTQSANRAYYEKNRERLKAAKAARDAARKAEVGSYNAEYHARRKEASRHGLTPGEITRALEMGRAELVNVRRRLSGYDARMALLEAARLLGHDVYTGLLDDASAVLPEIVKRHRLLVDLAPKWRALAAEAGPAYKQSLLARTPGASASYSDYRAALAGMSKTMTKLKLAEAKGHKVGREIACLTFAYDFCTGQDVNCECGAGAPPPGSGRYWEGDAPADWRAYFLDC
jgi:hypothetical protein